ncbi:hypothetical protein DPMN_042095 [Dreissena polymorpha]|uniref:Uncharacterized protein n=1 Tax=Dreissena polymorpha TaxID=45954 RepID=A0A9D4D0H2_DREPO|nr:hypothetical protein DPMN_042095 [Dreissena polymorpha]
MLDIVNFCISKDKVAINPEESEIHTIKGNSPGSIYLNGAHVKHSTEVKHLGIIRTPKNNLNTDDHLKTERQTIYALIGPGLNAIKGFSPVVALKLWNTYAMPRALYGVEILKVTTGDIEKLDRQHRSMFKHFQGLPARIATAEVHLLLGSELIESIIDRPRLRLFTNISRLKGSEEYNILSRQIIMAIH